MLPRIRRGGTLAHPHLEAGQSVMCLCSADDCYHVARILRAVDNGDDERYYVHYVNQPTRLDEWVTPERIDFDCDPEVLEDTAERRTRAQRRRTADDRPELQSDPERAEGQKPRHVDEHVKNVDSVILGYHTFHQIAAWYYSPYPEAYIGDARQLIICEYCLKYFPRKDLFAKHKIGCHRTHPPGFEVYRHNGVSVYEVDGAAHKVYCQCLCLLARLFLEHKTLCFDVESFMFYIMLTDGDTGRHIVGYFSKEKVCHLGYNLACILVIPPYQKLGHGRDLIQLAYELSRRTGTIGTPERPLSDLGLRGFYSYWKGALLQDLKAIPRPATVTVTDIAARTCISTDDVVYTLRRLKLLREEGTSWHLDFGPDLFAVIDALPEPQNTLDLRFLRWPLKRCEAYTATQEGDFFELRFTCIGATYLTTEEDGAGGKPDRTASHTNGAGTAEPPQCPEDTAIT